MLITSDVRSTNAWAELHLAWENLNTRLGQAGIALRNIRTFLNGNDLPAAPDQQALEMEATSIADSLSELATRLSSILDSAPDDAIHWVNVNPNQGTISLNSAPLDVSPRLAEELFAKKGLCNPDQRHLDHRRQFRIPEAAASEWMRRQPSCSLAHPSTTSGPPRR